MSSPEPTVKQRQIHFIIFSAAVTVGILAYLFAKVSFSEVIDAIEKVHFKWIVLFLIFSLSMSFFRTWRYQLVLSTSGYRVNSVALFLITLVRNFFSDLLPARLGTLIYVYLVKSRLGLPIGPVMSSFAHSFIFDIISLAFLVFFAAGLIAGHDQPGRWLLPVAIALTLVSIGVLLLLPALCRLGVTICIKLPLPEKWITKIVRLFQETLYHLQLTGTQGIYLPLLALSLAVRLSKYISYYMLLAGLVIPLGYTPEMLNPSKVFLGLCCAETAASLPISGIAGFGAYEGAWALVFQLLGYPEHIAVLTSISHHLFTQMYGYLMGGIALAILLLPMFRNRRCNIKEHTLKARFWLQYVLSILVIAALAFFLFPSVSAVAKDVESELRDDYKLPEGKVVYERPAGIYITSLQSTKIDKISNGGKHPRWSWDGKYIVFIRDKSIVLYSMVEEREKELIRVKKTGTVCFLSDNKSVLFSDKTKLYRLDIRTGIKDQVASKGDFRELGINRDGRRLVATVKNSHRVQSKGI